MFASAVRFALGVPTHHLSLSSPFRQRQRKKAKKKYLFFLLSTWRFFSLLSQRKGELKKSTTEANERERKEGRKEGRKGSTATSSDEEETES
jgi:hypothetical protein